MTGTLAFPRNSFLGFDHILKDLERISKHAMDSYPPHNVVKIDDKKFIVELAVAGFKKDDLNIEVKDHVLTVEGNREQRRDQAHYIHKGISGRKFVKSYRLSEYTEVTGADLVNGILVVTLEVRVPDEKLPRTISIN